MVSSKLLCQAALLLSVYVMLPESFGDYLYVGVLSQQTRRMLMLCYCLINQDLNLCQKKWQNYDKIYWFNYIYIYTHTFLD